MAAPVRTCVGCRTKRPQPELVRVARAAGGGLVVDRAAAGRGAWLCAATTLACFEQAVRKKAFARTLRVPVDAGAVESLRTFLSIHERMEGPRRGGPAP